MHSIDRFKLHGTYRTPRFRIGAKVTCQVRGELRIVGVSEGRIPWPLGNGRRGARSLVVDGDLARAIRRESVSAICYWFGVHDVTVWKWRKALAVPQRNYGTRKLWQANVANGFYWEGVKAGAATARDPIRRAKHAQARRGKRRSRETIEAARHAHVGAKHSPEARRKMSEAWKRRGKPKPAGGPWRTWEDDLVGAAPISEVVRWTGRTLGAVRWRRRVLAMTRE